MHMAKYEVLDGKHVEDGKMYKKGEIVSTYRPLDKMFGDFKFKRVEVPPVRAGEEGEEEDEGEMMPSTKRPGGKKVSKSGGKKGKRTTVVKKKDGGEPPELAGRGEDVTKDFPTAEEYGLQVFKRGNHAHVFEFGEKEPLNDEELTSKKATEEFIANWLES